MTQAGSIVLTVYSLAVVSHIAYKSFRKLQNRLDKGWEAILLVPVLILLINQI